MKLLIPIAMNIALVIGLYLADRIPAFKRLPRLAKQVIYGVLFGALSAFSSDFGVALLGTTINVRDAAPISAGLIFGAPAGIISGLIGGLYRWVAVFWGAGEYTRLACTIATILSGLVAALLRKLMFDDKKPTWSYGVSISAVCEVLHMMLIFLTNMNDSSRAFRFVRSASIPMIIGNALAVGLSIVAVSLMSRERLIRKRSNERISQTFQRWLLVCIMAAYIVTSTFTFTLQNGMAKLETSAVISIALDDVQRDIAYASDQNLLKLAREIKKLYEETPANDGYTLKLIAKRYDVSEINIIDTSGLIVASSVPEYVGYEMASGEQSAEFLCLLHDEEEFVQEYRRTSYDAAFLRKYAGVALEEGGFIQVGYDSERFQLDISQFIIDATKNRHVGQSGFVAICDENFNLLADNEYSGVSVSSIGIELDPESMTEKTVYDATVMGTEYLFGYTAAEGYYIIGAMQKEEAMFMRDASIFTSLFMEVLIFATLFVFIYFLIKRVIINNLQKINASLAQITDGNLNVTVDVRTNQEFSSLSDDINSTVSTLKRYISEAAARIDMELEYAKQIQLSALPVNFPDNSNYSIYARMIAAKEVGGDFYDFYHLDRDTVAFLAADVSGKGIPAAMFMMTAKTIIKGLAERGLPVNDIFTLANEKLCENNESGMFVTAWLGLLDIPSGTVRFVNAGHNPPLLMRSNGETEFVRSRPGFVLAGMENIRYRVNELTLQPGDRLFLYTDGITEATDSSEQLYGEERLRQFMSDNYRIPGSKLLDGLKNDIDSFVGEATQFDDITMLILDYPRLKVEKRTFPAREEELGNVLGFLEQELEKAGCSPRTSMGISVAIEELFINISRYAYGPEGGTAELEIGFDRRTDRLCFVISDSGKPFDPLKKPDPDITLGADQREIGGLGIFITKKTMDSISYRRENGRNILTMTKTV